MNEVPVKIIDQDWVALILEAKSLGLTKEEIQAFLEMTTRKHHIQK
ncbi:anti-repressor SinI family protein [Pseudalkalibacillus sp. Hm43]